MSRNCKDCGEPRGKSLWLWIDDKSWEKIGAKPDDFLCAHCIVNRLGGVMFAAYLVSGSGKHKIKAANAKIEMKQKVS